MADTHSEPIFYETLTENGFEPRKRRGGMVGYDLASAYDTVIPKHGRAIVMNAIVTSTDLFLLGQNRHSYDDAFWCLWTDCASYESLLAPRNHVLWTGCR